MSSHPVTFSVLFGVVQGYNSARESATLR